MALPDSLKQVTGTKIVLADSTDYSPSGGQPTRTDQLDVNGTTGGTADGEYRQSTKFDLGANRAPLYKVNAFMEFFAAPTAGQTVDFYIGFSSSATEANDNPANLSGSDSDYVGYGAAATDADECISQLDFIGSMVLSAYADVHAAEIGTFIARDRYAMVVVKNDGGATMAGTDSAESCVVITPLEHQVQD